MTNGIFLSKSKLFSGLADFSSEIIMIMLVSEFIPFTHANCYSYNETLCTPEELVRFFEL